MQARHRARCVVEDYNKFSVKDVPYDKVVEARVEQLKKVVGKVGTGSLVEPPFNPDYGCNVVIGNDTYVNFKFVPSLFFKKVYRCTDKSPAAQFWIQASSPLVIDASLARM